MSRRRFVLRVLVLVAIATVLAGAASAQTDAPAPGSPPLATGTGRSNAAINPTGNAASSVNASGTIQLVPMAELARGANSFTEGKARGRVKSAGFTDVSRLTRDAGGIWRGQATRDGRTVAIGFDYKGQIAAQ